MHSGTSIKTTCGVANILFSFRGRLISDVHLNVEEVLLGMDFHGLIPEGGLKARFHCILQKKLAVLLS